MEKLSPKKIFLETHNLRNLHTGFGNLILI